MEDFDSDQETEQVRMAHRMAFRRVQHAHRPDLGEVKCNCMVTVLHGFWVRGVQVVGNGKRAAQRWSPEETRILAQLVAEQQVIEGPDS